MLGLSCAEASLGYGGTLRLGFGERVEYERPKWKGKYHRQWQLYSNSGSWRILRGPESLAGYYDDESIIGRALEEIVGLPLRSIEIPGETSDTRLNFGQGLSLDFLEQSSKEPNWRVHAPGWFGEIGPGRSWDQDPDSPGLDPVEEWIARHTEACAERWAAVLPPIHEIHRCAECRFYFPLQGQFHFWDFGLCTGPLSPFDGRVVERDRGCPAFEGDLEET